MLLVIDCGNTNIVFAVYKGDRLMGQWRTATQSEKTGDDYGVWLTQIMQRDGIARDDVRAAIVSSVVPSKDRALRTMCQSFFEVNARFVGDEGLILGLNVLLQNPREVGDDRLVNAIAAQETYGGPLIIIDFGTATTFDVVDKDGNYAGGVITPGINLSMEALHMATALLPKIPIENPGNAPVVGTSTVEAMRSGVFWGYIGLIEGLVGRIQAEQGPGLKVIATGGLAPLFAESVGVIDHTDDTLTLRGLRAVHERNPV
ncbi:MAG: type III pantothenate kinase [Rhodospirillaceae bacterium]